VTPATASGRTALLAASHRVAIAAAHTNLDVARDGAGTSDPVARVLGLQRTSAADDRAAGGGPGEARHLRAAGGRRRVLDALAAAGAGRIGDYERCSFRVRGTGTFRPGPGADPYSGTSARTPPRRSTASRSSCPGGRAGAVVAALVAAHPYEEVAYDLVPLVEGAEVGFGCLGNLPAPRTLARSPPIRPQLPAHTCATPATRTASIRTVAASAAPATR
jgi:hypothetical protein